MTYYDLQPLPLGSSTFATLRESNEIYVDKTAMVFDMARVRGKYFIARPRRFGKSLLVSTFESLFKHGLRDFKGLAIENHWNDKTYTVIRLDFSESKEFSSPEEFTKKFYERVESKFNAAGVQLPQTNESFITRLSNGLQALQGTSLVLLIDEYDAPLTACIQNQECFNAVRSIISELFLTIKANEGCLRFFFMTGITKFSNTSIFSAFNNLKDISLIPAYGTLLGITEDELKHYFGGYLTQAANVLKMTEKETLDRLRENYNGFSFDDRASTHVYCPWSILQFFSEPDYGFQNYWYESGGQPTMVMNYFSGHELPHPSSYYATKEIDVDTLKNSSQYDELPLDSLLTQAGYLTIKSRSDDGSLVVGYPNKEVEMSMAKLYAKILLNGNRVREVGAPTIATVMANDDTEAVIRQFNYAFNAIDYARYPVKDEALCRGFLHMLLHGAAMMPQVENHTALGRSDLEVEAGNRHWVFEIKFARNAEEVDGLLSNAVAQVQARRYGELAHGKELIRVALVFSETERQFVAWEEI